VITVFWVEAVESRREERKGEGLKYPAVKVQVEGV
jgi:hypothetical protein